jgi:hypothetical protein
MVAALLAGAPVAEGKRVPTRHRVRAVVDRHFAGRADYEDVRVLGCSRRSPRTTRCRAKAIFFSDRIESCRLFVRLTLGRAGRVTPYGRRRGLCLSARDRRALVELPDFPTFEQQREVWQRIAIEAWERYTGRPFGEFCPGGAIDYGVDPERPGYGGYAVPSVYRTGFQIGNGPIQVELQKTGQPCKLYFTSRFVASQDWESGCSVLVHEFGHLVDFRDEDADDPSTPWLDEAVHSDDASDPYHAVMQETPGFWPGCSAAAAPFEAIRLLG